MKAIGLCLKSLKPRPKENQWHCLYKSDFSFYHFSSTKTEVFIYMEQVNSRARKTQYVWYFEVDISSEWDVCICIYIVKRLLDFFIFINANLSLDIYTHQGKLSFRRSKKPSQTSRISCFVLIISFTQTSYLWSLTKPVICFGSV